MPDDYREKMKAAAIELRGSIDKVAKAVSTLSGARSTSITVTKLEEAKMWLGRYLGELGFTGHEASDLNDVALAEKMFAAYNECAGGKTWDGKDIPPFSEVGDKVRANWIAAAKASRK